MIPYDDLVAALASWRAKQGLPGNTLTPAASAAPAQPAPAAKSGGTSKSGPKQAPPGPSARSAPAPVDDHYDVDEAALLEEASYGDEYGAYTGGNDAEATSIGGAPSAGEATIDEDMFGGSNPGPAPKKPGSGPSKRSDW